METWCPSAGGTTFDSVASPHPQLVVIISAVGQSVAFITTYDASSNDNGNNWCTPTQHMATVTSELPEKPMQHVPMPMQMAMDSLEPTVTVTIQIAIFSRCTRDLWRRRQQLLRRRNRCTDTVTFYADDDGDTYGDNDDTTQVCSGETVSGYVERQQRLWWHQNSTKPNSVWTMWGRQRL